MSGLSRHAVLATQPLSEAALRRLQLFFDVETMWTERVPSVDELAGSLQGKAGVLTDGRLLFDAALIARLPLLRAACHAGPGPHPFDLPACTRAGIRATSVQAQGSARLREDTEARRIWEALLPVLQQAAPAAGVQGRYGRWSRPAAMAAAPRSVLALSGDARWAQALATLARDGGVRVLQADGAAGRHAVLEQADVLLLCDAGADAERGGGAPPMAWIVDGAALLAQAPQAPAPDHTRTAAEDLVAALGFGRHGWHPPNLLNPEILCESCC